MVLRPRIHTTWAPPLSGYPGDIVPPALPDLEKVEESALERCNKAVDCHEIVMTRPGRDDGSPDDRAAAFRPGEARTADPNPERRPPALSVWPAACANVKVRSSPKQATFPS